MSEDGAMSPRIFISYRRDDSPGSAGRLYDRLTEEFPKENLFMDVDAIAPGVDFISEIERSVTSCDVLLAIIGRDWLTATDKQGRRRLDDPGDFVRHEIATALKSGVRVVPVLVDGAAVPAATDLPDELQPLVRRNAVELTHHRFTADTRALAHALLSGRTADAVRPPSAGAMPAPGPSPTVTAENVAAASLVPQRRILAACATAFVIIASGAIGGMLFARPGDAYWFLRVDPAVQLWVAFNLMVGPALALRLWMPGLATQHFWGIVGATFGALVTLLAMQFGLEATLVPDASRNSVRLEDLLLAMALVHTPAALGSGAVLGYFLAQALRGWFPDGGGRGFVRRMMLIWMATGAIYAVTTFIAIAIGEAAAPRPPGTVVPPGGERMRLWTDTIVFGASWALGIWLTLNFASRATKKG
jgi:hypothetical protein